MSRNETEELWDVDDVARFLKLRPKTIRNRVSAKAIPYLKIDGILRFDPAAVRSWVETEAAKDARKTA